MPGFTLRSEDGKLRFTARFFEREPRLVEGGPVLARVPRPKQKSLTEWTNREPFALEVSYKFHDEEGRGYWIEQELRKLEKLMGLDKGDPEPPPVIILGDPPGCIPHDFHDNAKARWWVESVSPDDGARRNDEGNRIFETGIIKLVEVVEDETLQKLGRRGRSGQRRYKVKKGDTLSKIAKRFKVKGGWKALAKANNIRDPKKLKTGQTIRIP